MIRVKGVGNRTSVQVSYRVVGGVSTRFLSTACVSLGDAAGRAIACASLWVEAVRNRGGLRSSTGQESHPFVT